MTSYSSLALLYDQLMDQVDYQAWANYLDALIKQFGAPGNRLLDLGCGTGTLTINLLQKGYRPVGVDLSPEMLSVALDKGMHHGLGIENWLAMDMRSLQLPAASFDIAICACDGFNYLRNEADLEAVLGKLKQVLRPSGLLLFDLHSEYKMRQVFPSGPFVQESGAGCCIWWSQFDEASRNATHEMTIFVPAEGDLWRRQEESHQQHYFAPPVVEAALSNNGFSLLTQTPWGQLSGVLTPTTERIQFVGRRTDSDIDS